MYSPVPIPKQTQYFNNHWSSYSPKINREVSFSSQLDYEYWLTLELDSSIISFCERPVETKVILNKNKYKIAPNFWVKKKKDEIIIDVFVLILYKDDSQRKVVFEHWCNQHNYKYQIIDKTIIRNQPALIRNAKMILPYLRTYTEPAETDLHVFYKEINEERQSLFSLLDKLKNRMPVQRAKQLAYFLMINNSLNSNIYEADSLENIEVWR